jgi:hypothetical protein
MDYPLSQATTLDLYNGKFDDGVPGVREASIIPSETMNAVVDEILAVQAEGGQVADETKKTQLRDAIKTMIDVQSGNFCLDTGAANAYVVALDPPITAYGDSFTVRFRVGDANTGASTLDAGGGPVALNNNIDVALADGDLPASAIATATYVPALGHFNLASLVPSQVVDVIGGATGAATMPGGTTAQRPARGVRINTELGVLEAFIGGLWGAVGKIKQVVYMRANDNVTTTSGITVMAPKITPKSNSSRVLVLFGIGANGVAGGSNAIVYATLNRDGTQLGGDHTQGLSNLAAPTVYAYISGIFIDNPATTGELTYGLVLACGSAGTASVSTVTYERYMLLLEIE